MLSCVSSNGRFNVAALQWFSLGALFTIFYARVVSELVYDWYEHSTFSYAFLVPLIAGYLVWRRWDEINKIRRCPDLRGALLLLVGVGIGIGGAVLGDSFSTRVSLILSLGSIVLLIFGKEMLRKLLFPLFYLSLMIPIPYTLVKDLTFHLRYSDASHAASALQFLGLPVYQESYFLHLPNMSLEVADVCSGVSSVFALFALGVFYAHFLPVRFFLKVMLVICTFPFALIANLFRIILTVILAYNFGPAVFESYFHAFSGTFTFVLALAMLLGVGEILKKRFSVLETTAVGLNNPVVDGAGRESSFLSWGSFVSGALILLSAVYFSVQLDTELAHSAVDLKSIAPGNQYRSVRADLDDGYKDPDAETSLSEVFVAEDGAPINLFIGYRANQNAGIRLRSPKLYFPDKWNSAWFKPATLAVSPTSTVNGNWMLARKGDSAELIIYWYQIAGRAYAGEFEYRLEQLRRGLFEGRSDAAVVRITTPLHKGESLELAQARLQKFGIGLYGRLAEVLPK
jgi:EpsI family protein